MLSKALVLLVPAALLFSYSFVLWKRKARWSSLQLIGSACLVVVVLTHVCEALRLFPWMQWGAEHSVGHYLDLSSAVLGLTLFPAGYLIRLTTKRRV
jgi:succinate dehydrogenase/fumarate reductase cytochrome b subunit